MHVQIPYSEKFWWSKTLANLVNFNAFAKILSNQFFLLKEFGCGPMKTRFVIDNRVNERDTIRKNYYMQFNMLPSNEASCCFPHLQKTFAKGCCCTSFNVNTKLTRVQTLSWASLNTREIFFQMISNLIVSILYA